MDNDGGFECLCPPDYTGPTCSIPMEPLSTDAPILPIAVSVAAVVILVIIIVLAVIVLVVLVPVAKKHHMKRHDSYSPAKYELKINRERLI